MLRDFVYDFGKQISQIYTVHKNAPNDIVRHDESGLYVETASSRKKFLEKRTESSNVQVLKEWILESFDILKEKETVSYNDLEHLGRRHSFLFGYLNALPFTELLDENEPQVKLMAFTTADVPESSIEQVMTLYNELKEGQFKATEISQTFPEDNVKRLKLRAREALNLLSYLNEDGELITQGITKADLATSMLEAPYIKLIYNMLHYMNTYNKNQKLEVLIDLAFETVVSSRDGTQIKQSVAEKRTHNILNWLKYAEMIDQDWNVIPMEFASPFNTILNDIETANWAFDLMKSTLERLKVTECDNEKAAITCNLNNQDFRVNYANWSVLIFSMQKIPQISVALFEDDAVRLELENVRFNFKYGEPKINLYQMSFEQFKDKEQQILPAFFRTMDEIALRFGHHQKSNVRHAHQKAFCEAIFHKEKRQQFLSEGISGSQQKFWWVNQGKTAAQEVQGGYLWAPKAGKNGHAISHHTDLLKAEPGDIVFAYSNKRIHAICKVKEAAKSEPKPQSFGENTWQDDGNLLKAAYYQLEDPITKEEIPLEWRIEETGPFDRNGDIKQGYFFGVSQDFANKLISQFPDRLPDDLHLYEYSSSGDVPQVVSDPFVQFENDLDLTDHIYSYIKNQGFYYKKEEIKNLYLSLKTKPFVIISGISGTGKTKIVEKFAESLDATEENGQFKLIPVRPDWSDGSDLIGYEDIKGEFKVGPLTELLLRAEAHPEKPYFVLLDEMNLARVEYYFSDLLSIMESRKWKDGEIITSPVLEEQADRPEVIIPANVYMIGTVNMDETTHPFSAKVLDRANTIEFNTVELDIFIEQSTYSKPAKVRNADLMSKFLTLKDAFSTHETLIRDITERLVEINRILQVNNSHFGYRVRDEVCFYMIYNEQSGLMSSEEAFDLQLLQKILPKISGSDERTADILEKLFKFCTDQPLMPGDNQVALSQAKYPRSAAKLADMYDRQDRDGFTSFWLN